MSQTQNKKASSKQPESAKDATTPVKFELNKDKLFGLTGFTTMAVTTN